jgi:hypothetical protein
MKDAFFFWEKMVLTFSFPSSSVDLWLSFLLLDDSLHPVLQSLSIKLPLPFSLPITERKLRHLVKNANDQIPTASL